MKKVPSDLLAEAKSLRATYNLIAFGMSHESQTPGPVTTGLASFNQGLAKGQAALKAYRAHIKEQVDPKDHDTLKLFNDDADMFEQVLASAITLNKDPIPTDQAAAAREDYQTFNLRSVAHQAKLEQRLDDLQNS